MLNSGAKPDNCGVCNGDNSGASLETSTITGSGRFGKQVWKIINCSYLTTYTLHSIGYHDTVVIPTGARNVRIAETASTSSTYLGML